VKEAIMSSRYNGLDFCKRTGTFFTCVLVLGAAIVPAARLRGDVRFAVVSDFGSSLPGEASGAIAGQIADQVKRWDPDFIVTAGDINHDGSADWDTNVGQYFHEYIGDYQGAYGAGATTNRFFPTLGNHDNASLSAYRNYFTLPGNERYYDFQEGAAHFFIVNSNTNEPDGYTNTSRQAQDWLKPTMAGSTSPFNFVLIHHAPYTSSTRYYGGIAASRWDYAAWGADAVFSGHAHVCERLSIDGLTYFVTGVSGEDTAGFNAPIEGSQFRYGNDYGFMVVDVSGASATFRFVNLAGEVVDTYTQLAAPNEWGAAEGGSFNSGTNWTLGRYPSAPDAVASFRRATGGSVTVDSPVTIGQLDLESSGGITLCGPEAIRVETTGSTAAINARDADHLVCAPLELHAATTASVFDGSLTLSGPITGAAGATLSKTGGGTLVLSGENSYGGGTAVTEGTLLAENASGSATGTGEVTVGAATLGGSGFIDGPVTLTGGSTLTSADTLTINGTLAVHGLANQLAGGTVLVGGEVTVEPGAELVVDGTLGGDLGTLAVSGTLMGDGTIVRSCVIGAGGALSPGRPSNTEGVSQMQFAAAPHGLSLEIEAARRDHASAVGLDEIVRPADDAEPITNPGGNAAAALTADTVVDVYLLSGGPAAGEYETQLLARPDLAGALAGATLHYWYPDPRGSRAYDGDLYSPLDPSLVDWSVVPRVATLDGQAASGYVTQFTVAPEPATSALLAAAGLLLAVWLRRASRTPVFDLEAGTTAFDFSNRGV
jgi:autotransporter-associated beta strand protein